MCKKSPFTSSKIEQIVRIFALALTQWFFYCTPSNHSYRQQSNIKVEKAIS